MFFSNKGVPVMDQLPGNIILYSVSTASLRDDADIREEFERIEAWGLEAQIDLHFCNGDTIRNAHKIRRFVRELCVRIQMKRFGPCRVVNFGEDERVAGYSMIQLIETSCISGHFANQTNHVYLNIFSCKFYKPREAAEFAKEFFGAADYTLTVAQRK